MKRLYKLLLRLYPSEWRARYGEELDALLEDDSAGFSGVLDILKGSIRMQFSTRQFPKLALLLSISGILAGLAASYVVTPQYVSSAVLGFRGTPGSLSKELARFQRESLSRRALAAIIGELDLYSRERQRTPLEDVIDEMRRHIRIERLSNSAATLSIQYVYDDPHAAQQTVRRLARNFPTAGNMDLLDPASLPVSPTYPHRGMFAATGFLAGGGLALLLVTYRRLFPPRADVPAASL